MERSTTKRFFCGHCNQNLSKTVFYQHRRLYYNIALNEWSKSRLFSASEQSFTVSDDQMEKDAPVEEPVFSISDDESDYIPGNLDRLSNHTHKMNFCPAVRCVLVSKLNLLFTVTYFSKFHERGRLIYFADN